MGATEYGAPQVLGFDFKGRGLSASFNRLNFKVQEAGVYEGFAVSRITDTQVSITAGTCYIQDSANNLGVRVSTGTPQLLTVSTTFVYVVLRMIWLNVESNYMDMLAVTFANVLPDDIVLARCVYDGAVLNATFDTTRRKDVNIVKVNNWIWSNFKVLAKEPITGFVNVSSGNCLINGVNVSYAGGDLSIPSTTLGRNDLITINSIGTVELVQGVDAGSPITPNTNNVIIAEIKRGASRSNVNGSEIFQKTIITNSNFVTAQGSPDTGYIQTSLVISGTNLLVKKPKIAIESTIGFRNLVNQSTDTTIDLTGLAASTWYAVVCREDTGAVSAALISSFSTGTGGNWVTTGLANNQLDMYTSLYDFDRKYCRAYNATNYFRVIGVFKTNATPNGIGVIRGYSILFYIPNIPKTNFYVYRAANQTTSGTTLILHDTYSYDINSEYDTVNKRFVPKKIEVVNLQAQIGNAAAALTAGAIRILAIRNAAGGNIAGTKFERASSSNVTNMTVATFINTENNGYYDVIMQIDDKSMGGGDDVNFSGSGI